MVQKLQAMVLEKQLHMLKIVVILLEMMAHTKSMVMLRIIKETLLDVVLQ